MPNSKWQGRFIPQFKELLLYLRIHCRMCPVNRRSLGLSLAGIPVWAYTPESPENPVYRIIISVCSLITLLLTYKSDFMKRHIKWVGYFILLMVIHQAKYDSEFIDPSIPCQSLHFLKE